MKVSNAKLTSLVGTLLSFHQALGCELLIFTENGEQRHLGNAGRFRLRAEQLHARRVLSYPQRDLQHLQGNQSTVGWWWSSDCCNSSELSLNVQLCFEASMWPAALQRKILQRRYLTRELTCVIAGDSSMLAVLTMRSQQPLPPVASCSCHSCRKRQSMPGSSSDCKARSI